MSSFSFTIKFFIIPLILLQISGLYGQSGKSESKILGKWKVVKVKIFFTDRINKDSLTSREREEENFFRSGNIGQIVRITSDKFYFIKKGETLDTINYVIKRDSLFFNDKKVEWLYKDIFKPAQFIKITGDTLIVDMRSAKKNNGVLRWTLKKINN